MLSVLTLAALLASCSAHDHALPLNPALGVPGYPDCKRANPHLPLSVEEAAMDLICHQRGDTNAIKIGCVGDSITAGVHSTGGVHTYPAQLQMMLDSEQGKGKYSVTNMGACGSMMLRNSSSPFWERPQFKTLTANKWDILVIMLGTNDAHNDCNTPSARPGCSSDWYHDCGGPNNTSLDNCRFAQDFASMVKLIQTLGTTSAGPKVYVMTPPPLMSANSGWPEMQTTINTLYPKLIPLMQQATPGVLGPIDVYAGMGGIPDWSIKFPASCTLNSPWPECPLWCDKQSCDQCHPNNVGYTRLAKIVYKGLGFGTHDSIQPAGPLGSWKGSWQKNQITTARSQLTLLVHGQFRGSVSWASDDGFVGKDIDGYGNWKQEPGHVMLHLSWASAQAGAQGSGAWRPHNLTDAELAPYESALWFSSNKTLEWDGHQLT